MRRTASLAVGHSHGQTLRSSAGCQLACAWFKLVLGWEAMSTGSGEMHLCLPPDGQSEEALASSTQADSDWKKVPVQGNGVTSYSSQEAGRCMEACLLPALFPHRTPHKLLHSALADKLEDSDPQRRAANQDSMAASVLLDTIEQDR
jgi:hypothetical protein